MNVQKTTKKTFLALLLCLTFCNTAASYADENGKNIVTNKTICSPDGKLVVNIEINEGKLTYSVTNEGRQVLMPSALGLVTDMGDYTKNLTLKDTKEYIADYSYTMRGTKCSGNHYVANAVAMTLSIPKGQRDLVLLMQVSNNNIAYRYHFDGTKDLSHNVPRRVTVLSEASAFKFPEPTTTFICPQIDGNNTGWMGTKPSYEEEYKADAPVTSLSKYGHGYTFPCLFHEKFPDNSTLSKPSEAWLLVSETGTTSSYCGCHLSDYDTQKGYTIAFPDTSENHGLGSTTPAFSLPGETPWRTITVGSTLKPIVETTIPFDVVEEQYTLNPKLSNDSKPRQRYVWSWLIWQDNSANYEDQVKFIDVAAAQGYEYILVDGLWDIQMGSTPQAARERIAELSKYAQSKGVHLMLWYNSNGWANNAPQGPRNCMNTAIAREREMAWMESIGVKGIKVDFFGGDKQETIRLYEDILCDANRHGIQVIFHGCTLPRGWERMYPNFVASEAVLASENVFFDERHAKAEGFELTMHPFCRNAVASMDWGGTMMNHWLNKEDKPNVRHRRYTSDTFEMAASIMNQTSIQCIDLQPSNLKTLEPFELDFLKNVPTSWQKTQFIDGYPGKYTVLARQTTEGTWYVVGLNGETTTKTLYLNIPMFAGKTVTYYTDTKEKRKTVTYYTDTKEKNNDFLLPEKKTLKVDKKGMAKVTLQGLGGIILCESGW